MKIQMTRWMAEAGTEAGAEAEAEAEQKKHLELNTFVLVDLAE